MDKIHVKDLTPLEVTAWRRVEGRGKNRKRLPWPPVAGTIGVYGILHRPTRSMYVGYTAGKQGFKARWRNHKRLLFLLQAHHSKAFQDFVAAHGLRARDFELLVFSSYPASPRTKKLVKLIVEEEVLYWDEASKLGYSMLCERPLGVTRKYAKVSKAQVKEARARRATKKRVR